MCELAYMPSKIVDENEKESKFNAWLIVRRISIQPHGQDTYTKDKEIFTLGNQPWHYYHVVVMKIGHCPGDDKKLLKNQALVT